MLGTAREIFYIGEQDWRLNVLRTLLERPEHGQKIK